MILLNPAMDGDGGLWGTSVRPFPVEGGDGLRWKEEMVLSKQPSNIHKHEMYSYKSVCKIK